MFHRTIIKAIDIPFQGKTMLQENVESFLSLSRSRYCTILPAMRCVVLCITSTWQDEVIKVLARAEALSQVVFIKIVDSSPPPSWMARMLPDIHDFTYNTWSAFGEDEWRLLASFAHLRALAIYPYRDKGMTFPRDVPRLAFCHITTIQLRLLQSEELFEWMNSLAGSPLTRVETLDLKIYRASHKGWGAVQALNAFLNKNSKTMKHLTVVIDYTGRIPGEELLSTDDIDLSPLTNLRSLFLQTHDMDAVCASISSLTSPLVESLMVYTAHWAPDDYNYGSELECFCDFYDLLTKLARIMDSKQFAAGSRMLRVEATKQPRINGLYWVLESLDIRWPQRGVLALSKELCGRDTQRNTFGYSKPLVEDLSFNRSGRPPTFLR
ncbi:hypothetical protein BJ912DRAFT_235222 [Pholiota molesta]|nr:hypothetical protein BJ912DRAFT_235222 [Pholiota molesta]